MDMRHYILQGKQAIPAKNAAEWAQKFSSANRIVTQTDINNHVLVSTVFLGLDHSFGHGPPLLFETMVFGLEKLVRIWVSDGDSGLQARNEQMHYNEASRYSTWEEAEKGHEETCRKTRKLLGIT